MSACVALLASIPLYIKHNSYQLATGPDHHDKLTDTVVLPGTIGTMYQPAADDGVVWGACLLPLVLSAKAIDLGSVEACGLSIDTAIAMAVAMGAAFAIASLGAFLQQRRGEQAQMRSWVWVLWAMIVVIVAVDRDMGSFLTTLAGLLVAVVGQSVVTKYVVRSLAKGFTLGEAAVVAQALVLVAMDFAVRLWSSGEAYEDIGVVCLEAAVLGLLAMARVLASVFNVPAVSVIGSHKPTDNGSMAAVATFAAIVGAFGSASLLLVAFICRVNPVWWVVQTVLGSPTHLLTIAYWVALLAIGSGLYALAATTSFANSHSKLVLHIKRKSYHLLATLMFVPGFLVSPQLLHLGFTVALVGFALVECVRVFGIGPLAGPIRVFISKFVDHRDAGRLVTSHFYLLFGCALPVWLGGSSPVACLAGVLSLGIGDAVASLVGMRLGRVRWPGSPKTVEGTAGFVFSMFAVIQCIRVGLGDSASVGSWLPLLMLLAVSGILEAFTEQNDNLMIPMFMYAAVHAMSTPAGLDVVRLGPASMVAFAVVLPDVIDAIKQRSITGFAFGQ
ncbi:dolichol kinase [Linderina macrospora]|uniref:Dolichol kinase n=1 Tax=Linderina macrospora TaxID=4868 RepID=A0ACC1JE08_9FUNG|nr:dolichol kinase [Linderina macrospora]